MSEPLVDSPFKDAMGKPSVPRKGTAGGRYDSEPNVSLPARVGGVLPELYRDTHFGTPSASSGPLKDTPFKDATAK